MKTIRVVSSAALVLIAATPVANALQCRGITRDTFLETRHPNGAVTMGQAAPGDRFIATCAAEGGRVWCYITETERTVFTVRRFLEADRFQQGHSKPLDFEACLAD